MRDRHTTFPLYQKTLISRFNAGEILKTVTGGKGGGRPDMAQGGTKDVEGMDKAIGLVVEIIKQRRGEI